MENPTPRTRAPRKPMHHDPAAQDAFCDDALPSPCSHAGESAGPRDRAPGEALPGGSSPADYTRPVSAGPDAPDSRTADVDRSHSENSHSEKLPDDPPVASAVGGAALEAGSDAERLARGRVLVVGDDAENRERRRRLLGQQYDVVEVRSPFRALVRLSHEQFDAIFVSSQHLSEVLAVGKLLQTDRILRGLPDGVVLLDGDNTIIWGNDRLREWTKRDSVIGQNFYQVLGSPEILGPDFCPFHTAMATGHSSNSTLRAGDNRFYQVHATPLSEDNGEPSKHLVVIVRDVSQEVLQNQKLAAIHQAGVELADLKPDEVLHMTVQDRVELLKSNILHYTQDLLNLDVLEIRLLDPDTGRLEPLLAMGMDPEAENRELLARTQENGVTGFVAATGKSYLCEDTTQDPLYLQGVQGAKSSLTVPILLHDEVIGTFNVESPERHAFTESDLQFLEIFTRDLAVALNTLDLLAAEKASSTVQSVEAIHSAVAMPIDEILNDAVNIMERYIGHDPDVVERLRRVLRNARDIKQVIQKVGQKMTPARALPASYIARHETHPALRNRQVLVVDADESVRSAAHDLLERYGCNVETAHDGVEAVSMVRAMTATPYECIIADIRLPDLSGYDLMTQLRQIVEPLPLVLMTGFGYDPGHSIVKARQAGLQHVLYKPFRLDQLLGTVEKTVLAFVAARNVKQNV